MLKAQNALNFDGTDDYVTAAYHTVLNITTTISVEAWIKTAATDERYIVTKSDGMIYMAINGGGTGLGKLAVYLEGASLAWTVSNATVADGTWHHVAFTRNGTTLKLYVDGALDKTATINAANILTNALPTNAPTTFPIGASETHYDPLRIQPTNSVDFTAKVKITANAAGFSGTIANFVKVVPLEWDITPSASAGSTVLVLTNGGITYTPTTPKVGHYTSNVWQELAATHNAGTWTATTTTFSPFAIGDAGGFVSAVLAVELLDFKATALVSSNLLMWTTANEVNNKGFQVERLMDNGQWMILGFVNAKGKAATYDFTDNTPLQISYYRLRQMDNDGKEAFSKVVSVSINKNRKLLIYPNPVSNVLTMETTEQGDFQILNLLGQQVMTGKATQPIEVSALPQGAYFLKVGTEQVKFVKQ